MVRVLAVALGLAVLASCASSTAQASSPPAGSAAASPAAAPPLATGPQVVKGGEVFTLQGATVTIGQVTYINKPCPAGAQCLTSGIIKTVLVSVDANGTTAKGVLSENASRAINGVMVRVISVSDGPQAQIEASLPVAPASAPQ